MTSRLELLQGMPVFGAIREETLAILLARSSVVEVAAGRFFFREHDEGQSMFVLEAGQVDVIKQWQDRQYLLARLGVGDCFGEMSLMDLRQRSASVLAVQDCRAIEITSASLFELYEKDMEQFALIQMNMGREVSRRLRHADELLFRAKIGVVEDRPEYVFRST